MAYEGAELNACGVVMTDFRDVFVVAVSGDGPNVCGHLLIYSSDNGGYYFHTAGPYAHPKYMTNAGFQTYLADTRKIEIRRIKVELSDPQGAYAKMEQLLAKKWLWGVLPNNCVGFVEEIIRAGQGDWSSLTNCPAIATADSIKTRGKQAYDWIGTQISTAERLIYSHNGIRSR